MKLPHQFNVPNDSITYGKIIITIEACFRAGTANIGAIRQVDFCQSAPMVQFVVAVGGSNIQSSHQFA